MDFENIKLIIWDLDDTFWEGTLSEGQMSPILDNVLLVKNLSEVGIINSICSKNDSDKALEKLRELGIDYYFVFRSINWEPKGVRIAKIISDMGLRPKNVLFIDDNKTNIAEAKYHSPDIMVASPEIIPKLTEWVELKAKTDTSLQRLNQYRISEKRALSRLEFKSNEEFLFSSNIRVAIKYDCENHINRISELIQRTNQLNFTKKRIKENELYNIIKDTRYNVGYVTASDNYGDYGVVGFFAIFNNELKHFLFSCRTIGQGIEQWVYAILGFPIINVVEPVAVQLTPNYTPKWINQNINDKTNKTNKTNKTKSTNNTRIVFKGPCDLMGLSTYISSSDIIEEFNYVSKTRNNLITHHNFSPNYLYLPFISEKDKQILLEECIFNDEEMFHTALYDNANDVIFLSTLHEPNWGLYKRKGGDIVIGYGRWNKPLTDPNYWDFWINYKDDNNCFTYDWLKEFSRKYDYIGRLTPEDSFNNIKSVFRLISPKAYLCLILGSETAYYGDILEHRQGRDVYYKELNKLLRNWGQNNDRVFLLDFNDFITGQDSFTNNSNHFTREIYYKAAIRANQIIKQATGGEGIIIKNKAATDLTHFFHSSIYKLRKSIGYLFKRSNLKKEL